MEWVNRLMADAWPFVYILIMAFIQNVSFTSVSRARNRNNPKYHLFASIFSNTIWYGTLRALVTANMTWLMFLPYTFGTVTGSLTGAKISMRIERWLNATSDDHLKPREMTAEDRQQIWMELIRLTTDEEKRQLITRLQASV